MKKKRKKDDSSVEMEEVEEERYSTLYVVKNGLRAILMNNIEVIDDIERKAKKPAGASIRISRFLNLFVLRCLENNKDIIELNNSFI